MWRRRARESRNERSTILGGLVLGAVVLLVLAVTLVYAWIEGEARSWTPGGWVVIGAFGAVLLSLEGLFVRDYRRWRRAEGAHQTR